MTLLGPPPRDVIHEVDGRVLRAEAVGLARFRAEEIEEHPELFRDPAFRVELVLDLSCVLHTAIRGRAELSKKSANCRRVVRKSDDSRTSAADNPLPTSASAP